MLKPKETGLGANSFLLRRPTEETVERPDVSESAPIPTSKQPPTTRPADRAARPKPNKPQPTPRDRCTLYLDREINERLDLAAQFEDSERSEIVTKMLRQHLPKYRITLE